MTNYDYTKGDYTMNKIKSLMCLSLCMATVLSTMPIVANADDESIKYGTMEIPYAEFYANEGIEYDVDAVSSATTSKWNKESLVAGTYNQPNLNEDGTEDGTGTILGVVYYVALTDETLEALGEDNYNFTEVEDIPSAYKEVTITEDGVEFSAVKGETTSVDATATISTSTPWGDYLLDVEATEENALSSETIGTTYGVILTTTDGDNYALRHLENIWRGEFAWSVGITTQEPLGNTLSYENFEGLNGATIDTITYITEKGYFTVDTELYVPKKFVNTLEVSDANISDGSTTLTTTGFPEDYAKTYTIDGLEATVSDDTITFTDAVPGSYTLVISDEDGVYADVSASFILSTDETPAVAKGNALVKADGVTDEEFANFLANLSTATMGDDTYSLSGRSSVAIFNEDGSVNTDITQGSGDNAVKIFAEDGTYNLTVYATGYENPVEVTVTIGEVEEPITEFTIGDSTFPRGDVTLDGKVTTADLLMLKKYLLGLMDWE